MLQIRLVTFLFLSTLTLGLAGCQSQKEIVSNLSESDANQVLVVLASQKIDAQKVLVPGRTPTYSVTVKSSAVMEALKILVENRIPSQSSTGYDAVYPAGSSGLIPTKEESKAKFLMALQGEVESMLRVLPGVVDAQVRIVMPDTDTVRDINAPLPKATASVAIVYNPIDNLGGAAVEESEIRNLVASAVEDLSQNNVTVVMTPNLPLHLVGATPPVNSAAYKALQARKAAAAQKYAQAQALAINPQAQISSLPGETPSLPHMTEGVQSAQLKVREAAMLAKQQAAEKQMKKNQILIWLFIAVAVLGLIVGIFGIMRAIKLKNKLALLEAKGHNGATAQIAQDNTPPSNEQPSAGKKG